MLILGIVTGLAFVVAAGVAVIMTLLFMATMTTAGTMDLVAVGVWWLVAAVLLVGLVCVQGFQALLKRQTPQA